MLSGDFSILFRNNHRTYQTTPNEKTPGNAGGPFSGPAIFSGFLPFPGSDTCQLQPGIAKSRKHLHAGTTVYPGQSREGLPDFV